MNIKKRKTASALEESAYMYHTIIMVDTVHCLRCIWYKRLFGSWLLSHFHV